MTRRSRRPKRRRLRPAAGPALRALEAAYERHRAGDLGGAERAYRRVLALDPGNAPALSHLAAFERGRGNPEAARALLSRAVESDPRDASTRSNLANLLQELGRVPEARSQYLEALRIEPSHLSARYNLGKALQRLGEFEEAVGCFEALCALAPEDAGAWTALGLACQDAGKSEQALASQRRALAIDPGHAEAHNSLGTLHMEHGAFAEAEAAFRAALRSDPAFSPAFVNLVQTRRIGTGDTGLVAQIQKLAERGGRSEDATTDLHFALAKAREDLGDYERAFAHYREGNRRRRDQVRYDRQSAGARAAALASAFGADFFARAAGGGDSSPRPVFIVGMPRSGTSLVEQILASHPDCFGAGELPHLGALVRSLAPRAGDGRAYPAVVEDLDGAALAALGRRYLEALPAEAGGAARVTDKMPANYLHIGLAAAILPRARVIWCRRSAMDVCFSIYTQQFTHRDAYPYACDLDDIASEYLACEQIMAHWTHTLPIPIHEVRYERLVGDQEEVTKGLLSFCGLPFDARCLRFHETERRVRTASHWQVRQPLYHSSVGRWRRYAPHLSDLVNSLRRGGVELSGEIRRPCR